ncbi:M20 aminoacylase family protein [Brucella sp. TWI432]
MQDIRELIERDAGEFIAIRRDLHQHPELAFKETRTAGIVASLLEGWGYTVERNIGTTGVVGRLRHGGSTASIGLRADMDALPIFEEINLPYASVNAGVMHACGHDGHTTMLLAAAKAIAERRNFNGTVNLIFQPAEEYGRPDSGAARMVADGLFQKYPCDAVFGIHNMPGVPQGQLQFYDGAMMASSDSVFITIEGRGGHGALPNRTADPIVATASIVMALQTIVARNVNPLDTAVVTVGVMQAGVANNVIPETSRIELTVRCFKPDVRDLLEQRITDLVTSQAQSFGVKATIDYCRGYPALLNSPNETEFARDVGESFAAEGNFVRQTTPMTGSEDFAFMLEECPGSYLFLGNGDQAGPQSCALHNPHFDFNDANIVEGAAYWVTLAEAFLNRKAGHEI